MDARSEGSGYDGIRLHTDSSGRSTIGQLPAHLEVSVDIIMRSVYSWIHRWQKLAAAMVASHYDWMHEMVESGDK